MRRNKSRGFSLVEVALAMGIASFCLVSLLGLVPVGVTSTGNAGDEARAMNAIMAIARDLATVPRPGSADASGGYNFSLPSAGGAARSQPFYVTESGQYAGDNLTESARYSVAATILPPASRFGTYLVRLDLSWPAGASLENATGYVTTVVALNRQ